MSLFTQCWRRRGQCRLVGVHGEGGGGAVEKNEGRQGGKKGRGRVCSY